MTFPFIALVYYNCLSSIASISLSGLSGPTWSECIRTNCNFATHTQNSYGPSKYLPINVGMNREFLRRHSLPCMQFSYGNKSNAFSFEKIPAHSSHSGGADADDIHVFIRLVFVAILRHCVRNYSNLKTFNVFHELFSSCTFLADCEFHLASCLMCSFLMCH